MAEKLRSWLLLSHVPTGYIDTPEQTFYIQTPILKFKKLVSQAVSILHFIVTESKITIFPNSLNIKDGNRNQQTPIMQLTSGNTLIESPIISWLIKHILNGL